MDPIEIIKKSYGVITRKPIYVTVPIKPSKRYHKHWLYRFLVWLKLLPSAVVLRITPPTFGNRLRMAPYAMNITEESFKGGVMSAYWQTSVKNAEDWIYILAVCIQNNRYEPEQSLMDFIRDNFDDEDIFNVLDAALGKIDLNAFTKSTILVKGIDVLNATEKVATSATTPESNKMGPQEQEEQIAPGVIHSG